MATARKGERKARDPNEELKKRNDIGMIEPKDERRARDPNEFSREELKRDTDKEMISPKEMKKPRKVR